MLSAFRPTLPRLARSSHPLRAASVVGPDHPALVHHTLPHHWLNCLLPSHHSKPALISKHEPSTTPHAPSNQCLRWSFAQFDDHINWLANGLIKLGVRKGDRIGIYSQNNSAYATLQWAAAEIGAILTTINPAYKPVELKNALSKVHCKVLFCTPSIRQTDTLDMLDRLDLADPTQLPHLESIVLIDNEYGQKGRSLDSLLGRIRGAVDYRDLLVRTLKRGDRLDAGLSPEDVINLQYTSGTTGLPKAAALTHSNILNNAIHIGGRMGLQSHDRLCNAPPLFHCFGLVVGNLAAWVHGASVVYASEGFDARATLEAVSSEQCTALHGVPTMFIAELAALDQLGPLNLSTLRTGVAAGSPVPRELMTRLKQRMHLDQLTILYGMTETSPASFQSSYDDNSYKRTETVGTILPHMRAKIVDQSGQTRACGEAGEVVVSGYALQKCYWEDEAETKKAMYRDELDGRLWMRTGDLGKLDEEGYLEIVGRSKDMIIRGGENLYPNQIEDCIITIDGVYNASVVGVPDDFFGEAVGVFIKRDGSVTREQICEVVENSLSHQSVPAWIWFLGTPGEFEETEFPMTASGKIRKLDLRVAAESLVRKGVGKAASHKKSRTKTA